MQAKLTTFLCLVALATSLVYCSTTHDIDITPDELIYATSEEDVMWDPTATTFFQKVLDGDIAYFTDKMTYGKSQPRAEESETGSAVPPTHTMAKRAATKDRRFLWPNGIIHYNISHSYSSEERNVILKALCMWEECTCIRFVQRTTQENYITIYPGGGCSSYIGRVGGNQGVSVGRSCFALHTVLHEVGHAIGFFHEQSRPDRDDYVDINYENIIPGAASQFKKLTYDDVDSLGVGYDYNSIMHYDHNLFAHSYELSTIEAKDPNIPVGGGRTLSDLDCNQTNLLYQCPEIPPPRSTPCPVEITPTLAPLPQPPYAECGGVVEITLDEWDKTFTIESPNYPTYTQNVDCGWLIRVPKGFQVMVTVEPMSIKRSSRCRDDHIEMYESFDTSGYHLGKHCGSYSEYRIMTITPFAYLHYHTGASSSTSGLKGFRARVEAFDIDECRWPDSCTNACNNIPGSFECSCPDGYFLSSNGKVCFDTNECGLGNGGCDHKCVNRGGGYHCECDEDFTLQSDGRTCSSARNIITVDLCEEANCDQLCGVFGDVARCACENGYALASDRRQCEDVNECATRNGGCDQVCMNTIGSFECSCHEGYHLASDGRGCEDINECATRNGGCEHTCTNTIGSFECSCRQGYKLSANGRVCEDINECATRNGGCEHTCTNMIGSFKCSCLQGYTLSSNGKTCEDINECRQSNPCSQVCVNTEGSYHCDCRDGYVLQGDGTTCLEETSDAAVPADAAVLTSPRGQFQTKNWPQTYPENVNPKWLIRCPSVNQRIDLNFNYQPFGIAGNLPECAKDWIKVYDGKVTDSDLLGKFCNYAVPVVRRSSTHELLIVLHAGPKHSPSRRGFKVSYTCVDVSPPRNSQPIMVEEPTVEDTKEDVSDSTEINIDTIPEPQCGAILTESSGSFHSPNWPETYPTDVLCEWTIVLPDDERRVQITFNNRFGIAGNLPECAKDWVKIYDGLGDDADESEPFCHYQIPETYVSSGHVAKVVLFAGPKHNAARKGFSATFRSV